MEQEPAQKLTRQELYDRLWSTATTKLAAELGISDVALAKRCKKLNVPKPPLGYWAKVAAGQSPPKIPLPPTLSEAFIKAAEQPVEKSLRIPESTDQLHPLAADLLRKLTAEKPDSEGRVRLRDPLLPEVTVSKSLAERAAKSFHVILNGIEPLGIPYRKAQSSYGSGFFRKGNDRLHLKIEEELISAPEKEGQSARRRTWQWHGERKVPSGALVFFTFKESYSSKDEKRWAEDSKTSLEELLRKIADSIRIHFAELQKIRAQEAIQREKDRIESERRWRQYQAEEVIQKAEESKKKHAEALASTSRTRSEDLLKAAEWWRIHQTVEAFIRACEQRWRENQGGEVTSEQQSWLAWARDHAKGLSPFDTGYPDPAKDGPFDAATITAGGPYPAKRDFPRPPTMPKIPPPVVQQSGYSDHHSEPPQPYPFWLKYQGR